MTPALAALLLLAPAPPQAQEAIRSTIPSNEPVQSTLVGDVDGDGLKDLVLLIGRRVAVHRQRADRSFPMAPDESIALPSDAVAVDLKPLEISGVTRAQARAKLIVAGAKGVSSRALDKPNAPFEALALPELDDPLIPRAVGAAPIEMTLVADLDGDGVDELILPTSRGAAVLRQMAGGWKLVGLADGRVDTRLETGADRPGGRIRQTFELPRIATVDVASPDGKRARYLAITQESRARIYALEDDHLSLVENVRALYRIDSEDRMRVVRGTRRNTETTDRAVGLAAVDLNGDGIPDFVSSRFRDGEVYLILGQRGEYAVRSPTRTIDVDGWVVLAQAKDFDGDGRPDLVVPRLPKLGILSALRVLLSRKISFDLWVFRNDGSPGIVGDRPAWKRTFDIEILLSGEEGQFSATTRLLTGFFDVNGDGLVDLVTRAEKGDRLAVYLGDRDSIIQEKSAFDFAIPPADEWAECDLRASDLDGDKRDDLILTYGPNRKGAKNLIVVVTWKPRG